MRFIHLISVAVLYCSTTLLVAQSSGIECSLTNLYQLTVERSPTLQRQQIQVRLAEVEKQTAASLFDYQLFSDLSLSRSGVHLFAADPRNDIIGNRVKTNNLALSVGVQRTFRTGMYASAGIEYARISDNFPFNSFSENIGAFVANNNVVTSLSIAQPLLRGKGRNIATANERIAAIGNESQAQNAVFISSSEIFNMVLAYCQYQAAQQSLAIYQINEARVRQVLEVTKELVNADKKPSSDLLQIQADLQDKERQTILAQQQLYAAQQRLGLVIGLEQQQSEQIGVPLNDFPNLMTTTTTTDLATLIDIAHQNRTDLKAIKKSLEGLSVLLEVAENNVKPQLDVRTFINYGGTDIGNGVHRFFSALVQQEGQNHQLGVGLNYRFPVNNNRAEAALLNSQLQYTDQQIALQNQMRTIELNVGIAYQNYQNSRTALEKSKAALDYYQRVFENEQFKFQTGLTTLLNLILLQERLTFAQLDYVNNQQQFANAIANLRFETGTLLLNSKTPSSDIGNIDPNLFYTLPTAN